MSDRIFDPYDLPVTLATASTNKPDPTAPLNPAKNDPNNGDATDVPGEADAAASITVNVMG